VNKKTVARFVQNPSSDDLFGVLLTWGGSYLRGAECVHIGEPATSFEFSDGCQPMLVHCDGTGDPVV